MRANLAITLAMAIWISIAVPATAFESDCISVKAEGNGPDLILIHGLACSPQVWAGAA